MASSTTIAGITQRYSGNGRALGYPTANLDAKTELIDGIYFGRATIADHENQPSLIFIGTPTTVGDTGRRVEAHLLDINDQDLYDQAMTLTIEQFHRHSQNLASIEALIDAIKQDEITARKHFGIT